MSSEPESPEGPTGGGDLPRLRAGQGEIERTDVLILGASFAGLEVLLQLQRRLTKSPRVVVVDRQAEHGYIPLVHERLCGRLPEQNSVLETAAFVDSLPGARFVCDEVVSFSPHDKLVVLASGRRVQARFVVVALGSVLEPPPTIAGGQHLLGHKFGDELLRAREHLAAAATADGEPPRVVVAGGGISGVELAGELAHLRRERPSGWVAPVVTLVAAGPRLLPELSGGVGRKAEAALAAQGVEIRLDTRLVGATATTVTVRGQQSTDTLPCAAAFWSGGIRPAPVLAQLDLPRTEDGWLSVGPTLQCFATARPTHPDVFACGDAVRIVGGHGQWPTMQRAIECLWQAKVVAKNLARLAEHPPDYPDGVPSLLPHVLRRRFAYGVSLGARSLVVYGAARVDMPGLNVWFRRWLMRQYFARYSPRDGGAKVSAR